MGSSILGGIELSSAEERAAVEWGESGDRRGFRRSKEGWVGKWVGPVTGDSPDRE